LKLNYHGLLSTFAFKFNLRRYIQGGAAESKAVGGGGGGAADDKNQKGAKVGKKEKRLDAKLVAMRICGGAAWGLDEVGR
jgi:hypothetical protein